MSIHHQLLLHVDQSTYRTNQPTVAGRVVGLVYAEADGRVPAKELRLEGSGLEGLGHTFYLGGRGQAFLGDILQCGEGDEWEGGGGGWMDVCGQQSLPAAPEEWLPSSRPATRPCRSRGRSCQRTAAGRRRWKRVALWSACCCWG